MAHTPGPWTVDDPWQVWAGSIGEYVALTKIEDFETVPPDQVVANAVLISAAPDLLSALKGTLYLFEAHAVSKTDLEQIAFARAAIAKATGTK